MGKHSWAEKLFFHLQLNEKRYFRRVLIWMMLLLAVQMLLTISSVRRNIVLLERFEGEPLRLLKKI